MFYARALQKVSRRSAGENGEQREKRQPQRQHEQRLTNNSNVIPQAADTGGFRGVTRKPLMKYYLGNVHPDSTEDDIKTISRRQRRKMYPCDYIQHQTDRFTECFSSHMG